MIDVFPPIYTAAAAGLKANHPGVKVTGEISDQVAQFPCAQIEEYSNVPIWQDSGDTSIYADLQIRVRLISNKKNGKISEARAMLATVDSVFEPLNIRRKSFVAQNGLYNNSAYRIEATYEVVADVTGRLYRK